MHAYLLVLDINPITIGMTYSMLPLHCTLVHWFWLEEDPEVVLRHLRKLAASGSIALTAGQEQTFTGNTKQGTIPVTVNDIVVTPDLLKLHEQTCDILEALQVQYSKPQYVRQGFHPHATHQKDGRLNTGDTHLSTKLYLVEADAPEYGNDRTVRGVVSIA